MARQADSVPKSGDSIFAWCWPCFTHREQKIAPYECLVVWDEIVPDFEQPPAIQQVGG